MGLFSNYHHLYTEMLFAALFLLDVLMFSFARIVTMGAVRLMVHNVFLT